MSFNTASSNPTSGREGHTQAIVQPGPHRDHLCRFWGSPSLVPTQLWSLVSGSSPASCCWCLCSRGSSCVSARGSGVSEPLSHTQLLFPEQGERVQPHSASLCTKKGKQVRKAGESTGCFSGEPKSWNSEEVRTPTEGPGNRSERARDQMEIHVKELTGSFPSPHLTLGASDS